MSFATAVPLDDSAMILAGVEVVAYLDGGGEQCYRLRHDGDLSLASVLGLLEMAKHSAIEVSDWTARGE